MADESTTDRAAQEDPVDSIEVDTSVKVEDAGDEGSENEDAEGEDEMAIDGEAGVNSEQYKALRNITEVLANFKIKIRGDEDYYPSTLFKRIPNKRNLPDYYQVIKEPSAISTLKGKIQRKQYTGIPEFVRDFALIVHNAQVYNRPNSGPVRDVLQLQTVFKQELEKLVEQGLIKEEETTFPDLGEIPYATPEPDPVSEDEDDEDAEGEDDGDEDDEEDEGDDSDDDRRKRRGRRGRASISGRKGRDDDDEGGKLDGATGKRRGRPPKVDTPMEARIKAIIKGLRKPKNDAGHMKLRHFERLPDKIEYPHYYQEIRDPIALDTIKKKAKRKKYQSVEHFMKDLELMFRNAMAYNEDSSDIYLDAVDLQAEAEKLVEIEKAKPDEEYLLEDGRLPLPNGILHKNELWKVGDWIHIQNPNDVTKPIVAQIYRTWQDSEGQKWINACWYYRPEQTVHQYEKHFYPNEVVKTGQYRDHQIEEVIDRCFVMFFTRYSRGRPRNFDPTKEVYVCEARYNEEKHRFNKIKTWASCLPDEVRDKDYEMDLFDAPRKIKKVPSPIKHLLKEEAKETDDIPSPQWGNSNAPPIVGAVHKQPRDENQSPPPEPTPPPPPTPPPQAIRPPSIPMLPQQQQQQQQPPPSLEKHNSMTNIQPQMMRPSPSMTPRPPSFSATSASPAAQYGRPASYSAAATHPYAGAPPQTPQQPQATPYAAQQQLHAAPNLSAAPITNYAGATPSQPYGRPLGQTPQTQPYGAYGINPTHEQRAKQTYVLSDTANESIPKEIRDQFPQDDQGRILFFTKPPVDTTHIVSGRISGEKDKPLRHSEEFLAARAQREKSITDRKRELEASHGSPNAKRAKVGQFGEHRDKDGRIQADPSKAAQIKETEEKQQRELKDRNTKNLLKSWTQGLAKLSEQLAEGHNNEYKARYGQRWKEYMAEDVARRHEQDFKDSEILRRDEEFRGQIIYDPTYDQNWRYDFWTGKYADDYDPRLPQ